MPDLADERCEACRVGSPPVADDVLARFQSEYPDWQLVTDDGIRKLRRAFKFPDFATALAFTDAVGAAAEAANHHPVLRTEWGRVTVTWWTHKIRDLHRNDLVMSARADRLYEAASSS